MKYFFIIIILTVFSWLEVSAQAATIEEPHFIDTKKAGLQAKSLRKANLAALEKRGHQKIKDFVNYLTILTTKKYNPQLKQKAQQNTLKLFEKGSKIKINWLRKKTKRTTVQSFLAKSLNTKYDKIKVTATSIRTVTPLTPVASTFYTGTIHYTQVQQPYKKNKPYGKPIRQQVKAEVILQWTTKKFGKRSIEVWKVLLADVSVLP